VGVLTLSDDTRMLARPTASAQRSGWRRTPGVSLISLHDI
jgi:hypothetical protein